ncbi:MAG: enoyl-CoA hydratase [Gammaproteobacteria bacterium WSBS_2016_MAG_OTU1]
MEKDPANTNDPILLTENRDNTRILTLNRPQSRNALSDALIDELHQALLAAAADSTVRVIIIAASGSVFCAGHDLREVQAKKGLADYRDLFNKCSAMMQAIVKTPQPVIAAVQGTATAAGCQLVASCDLAIAAQNAHFATPGVHIGLFCSTPMVPLSRNISRKQAMKMLFTGEPLNAADAKAAGLINDVVDADELLNQCLALAATIAAKSPLTLKIGKEAFYKQLEMSLADAYDYASEVMAENMTRHDAQEGISAFVQKRPPVWRGE